MQFNKFLAREKASSSSAPPPLHSSSQAFQAGYVFTDPSQASNYFSNTSNLPATVLQELEMHQMRERIIAAEVKRRLQIDAEVRKEMATREAIERDIALRRASTSSIPTISAPSTMMNHGLPGFNHFKGRLVDTFPFTRKPEYIVTPKENTNLSGLKRKAQSSPTPSDILPLATKPPRCELCNISATSEEQLKTHLRGKKHKTKELKKLCKTGVIGFGSKLAINNSRDEVLKQDEEQSHSMVQGVSTNPEDVMDADKAAEKVETEVFNYPFWCVICQVGTCSKEGMDAHLKGKKHEYMLSKDIA